MSGISSAERDELKRQVSDRLRQLIESEEKARAAFRAMVNDFDRKALADQIR
jgi:hypothetical protein